MSAITKLFSDRVISGETKYEETPAKLKQSVAEDVITAGHPELIPAEYGGMQDS